jgi:hypothetical protein
MATQPGPWAIAVTVNRCGRGAGDGDGEDVDDGVDAGRDAGAGAGAVTCVGAVVLLASPPHPLRANPASRDNFASGIT